MFLKDRLSGFPGGCIYFDPYMQRWYRKNHYSSLYSTVLRDRVQHGYPTANLDEFIQNYLCEKCSPDIQASYCSDQYAQMPKNPERRCRSCGGGRKR